MKKSEVNFVLTFRGIKLFIGSKATKKHLSLGCPRSKRTPGTPRASVTGIRRNSRRLKENCVYRRKFHVEKSRSYLICTWICGHRNVTYFILKILQFEAKVKKCEPLAQRYAKKNWLNFLILMKISLASYSISKTKIYKHMPLSV